MNLLKKSKKIVASMTLIAGLLLQNVDATAAVKVISSDVKVQQFFYFFSTNSFLLPHDFN